MPSTTSRNSLDSSGLQTSAICLTVSEASACSRFTWNGQDPALSLTEFWIVHALALHPGHVKSRQQLMDAANVVLDDNTITSHVKRIRRKFVTIDEKFDAIETVYGMGYRWLSD